MNFNIKNRANTFYSRVKGKLALIFTNKLYLSFGENCLADNILNRHRIKSFTSPFAHGRSNIEYILQLEKDRYKDFLDLRFLKYERLGEKEVPRLKKYDLIRNMYDVSHAKGFEFTHHDVIRYANLREKMQNRVQKLQYFKGRKRIIILYYHKATIASNMEMLTGDLRKLKGIYSNDKLNSEVVCFYQRRVTEASERCLLYSNKNHVHLFTFCTINPWGGENNDIFWATCDEDLISEMIDFIKRL